MYAFDILQYYTKLTVELGKIKQQLQFSCVVSWRLRDPVDREIPSPCLLSFNLFIYKCQHHLCLFLELYSNPFSLVRIP